MNSHVICIDDQRRILDFLRTFRPESHEQAEQIEILKRKLLSSRIVTASEISRHVVSMYSAVQVVELQSRFFRNYTLVYPYNADAACGRISLLSPLGTALLGCRAGESLDCPSPDASGRIAIREVLYQPEWDERNRLRAAHLALPK